LIVVIAEKPSVARDLAKVLGARTKGDGFLEGNGYRVGWCIGHLLELAQPESYDAAWKKWSTKTLPMLPAVFTTQPRKSAHKQLAVLKQLLRARDVTQVVNACDAGREGELIFRWLYEHVFARGGPPVMRLWIASLTDQAIAQGFQRLVPAQRYDALGAAARCRSEADWLVGLNATRAMTLIGRKAGADALLSVGRVQTPTLAMITEREDAIDAFVPEPFWQVEATFASAPGTYVGRWFQAGRKPHEERLAKPDEAAAIVKDIDGRPGIVKDVTREEQREKAPLLFDLTALQKLANQRFGLSADRTLKAAQALYEQHKAITYPRTDARFVTSDIGPTLPGLLRAQGSMPWSAAVQAALALGPKPQRKVVDDSEVGDHHAILPTEKVPDLTRLTSDEKHVYTLVARRLVAVFLPESIFDKRTVVTFVNGHSFKSEGRARVQLGWHAAEPPPPRDEVLLPDIQPGAAVTTRAAKVLASQTQPPKRFTEATLLGAMEHAGKDLDEEALRRAMRDSGLGTAATRASIIETLLTRDYIRRDGKALTPTASGRALIAMLPDGARALRSAELTGQWELRLARMARGEDDATAFMAEIRRFTTEVVHVLVASTPAPMVVPDAEALGPCPVCGTPVTKGRRAYKCATGRECPFVIFETIAGKTIKPALVKLLLARGHSSVLPGFRSKAGKRFQAALVLSADGQVSLDFGDGAQVGRAPREPTERAPTKGTRRARARTVKAAPDARPKCPKCGQGRVMAGNRAWGCTRWREGCDFVVAFVHGALRIPDDEAERLFRKGQTRLLAELDAGGPARLVLDVQAPGNVHVEHSKRRKPT